jgi:RNA polymerase sigma-70 factor, ECF subfamily
MSRATRTAAVESSPSPEGNPSPDRKAMAEDELRSVYAELRVVARSLLRREPYAHTLESCELVHQAWARVLNGDLRDLADGEPKRVLALAVMNMRRELVDHARRRKAAKRPSARARVQLEDVPLLSHENPETFLAVDALLDRLEAGPENIRNPARKAQCARYALYGGLSEAEIAELMDLPKSTVGSEVRFARAWISAQLEDLSGTGLHGDREPT